MTNTEGERTDWFWRNRFRVAVIILFVLWMKYVPFMPYKPYCPDTLRVEFDSHLKESYFQEATEYFSKRGLTYFTLGDQIFITFDDFLRDPSDIIDLLRNYLEKPIYFLGTYDKQKDLEGPEFYRRYDIWKSIPPRPEKRYTYPMHSKREISELAYCNLIIALTQKNPKFLELPEY